MKLKLISTILITIAVLLFCSTEKKEDSNQIIIGISTDIQTLNPLYASGVTKGNIVELLYLSLVEGNWNKELGEIKYSPMLASSWEVNHEENFIIVNLRDDVYWSDGVKCSVDDVIFSFDIYSDLKIRSRFVGYFQNFYTDDSGHINISKTFEKISNTKLIIKFKKELPLQLVDIDFPILPKHFFDKFKREEIPYLQTKLYITNGAYTLEKWEKEGAIILTKNSNSFLVKDETVEKIIFKVVPDYQNRISQVITGNIDLMEDVKTDDIKKLKEKRYLKISPIEGRDLSYIGWNNISSSSSYGSNKVPNNLFGSAKVRQALTHALDRSVMVEDFFNGYAQLASTPLSPMYSTLIDSLIIPLEYNPELAKEILLHEGWKDSNNDGTIDKNGIEFTFKLNFLAGNPIRKRAAMLFKNNLKAIGIDMEIESTDYNVFIEGLANKKFDAWMATWGVQIPVNLSISWHSDAVVNYSSYHNNYLDELFSKLNNCSPEDEVNIYYSIQKILYNDQPYTFLYWVDNLVCYNNRISNISIDPLGAIKHCWKWEVK